MKSGTTRYTAGLYLRLSKDDDSLKESASIATQRKMLYSFAKEHGYNVYGEYVDDGYSGTNFDRPAFQRMIRDVEDGKINMVITKDLSRLGRDYITAGQYTELFFPSKNVRYIAINDGYDSASPYNDIAPFKHVINEMYARDTSKKIRSAILTKMQAGSFIGNFAPYGYLKDPEDKNHLIADENTAPIVQHIFKMAQCGCRPIDIARDLNAKNTPTPAMYRCQTHPYLDVTNYSKRLEWTSATICKMLRNVVYLGHMAQGKSGKISFKSKAVIGKPPEDWIVIENTHEPLVSQETYNLVRQRTQSRTYRSTGDFQNMFSGIAKCMDCGRNMSATGSMNQGTPYRLACGGYKLYGKKECTNHFVDYQTLYDIVLQQLRKHICLDEGERLELVEQLTDEKSAPKEVQTDKKVIAALERRKKELDEIIRHLYEDNLSAKISDERFEKMLANYEQEQQQADEKINELRACLLNKDEQEELTQKIYKYFSQRLYECENMSQLPPQLLYHLIDHIEIGQGYYEKTAAGRIKHQEIKIHYRFGMPSAHA